MDTPHHPRLTYLCGIGYVWSLCECETCQTIRRRNRMKILGLLALCAGIVGLVAYLFVS